MGRLLSLHFLAQKENADWAVSLSVAHFSEFVLEFARCTPKFKLSARRAVFKTVLLGCLRNCRVADSPGCD